MDLDTKSHSLTLTENNFNLFLECEVPLESQMQRISGCFDFSHSSMDILERKTLNTWLTLKSFGAMYINELEDIDRATNEEEAMKLPLNTVFCRNKFTLS